MPATSQGRRSKGKKGKNKKGGKGGLKIEVPTLTAATADRHLLYQAAVQNVEAEIDFVDETFEALRGRKAARLREDFAGTGNTSCEWAKRRETNEAWGLDIDVPTLDWGREHNVGKLDESARGRVHLLDRDVRIPGDAVRMDCVLAMNFSYWLFQTREDLIAYFRAVRDSLVDDGILFCDFYGGSEAMTECEEKRDCELDGDGPRRSRKFTYVWDQHKYNPITGEMHCKIHFEFPDKTRQTEAFTYTWRLWTLPEMVEALKAAGFAEVDVYWEGDELDDDGEPTGEGDGVFTKATDGDPCESFICYIVCQK